MPGVDDRCRKNEGSEPAAPCYRKRMNFRGRISELCDVNKSIVFKFADVEVREREFCLVKAGEVLPVEPKTFRVLLFLLRNPQKLIAKEELLNAVWAMPSSPRTP